MKITREVGKWVARGDSGQVLAELTDADGYYVIRKGGTSLVISWIRDPDAALAYLGRIVRMQDG